MRALVAAPRSAYLRLSCRSRNFATPLPLPPVPPVVKPLPPADVAVSHDDVWSSDLADDHGVSFYAGFRLLTVDPCDACVAPLTGHPCNACVAPSYLTAIDIPKPNRPLSA